MKIKEKIFRTDLAYFAALDTRNDKILAGMAILDLPSIRQSIYYKAFSDDTVRRSSAATGLIDHWYRMSIQKGIRFQNFGVFWSPGQPRSWKGFSRFKAQFGVQMIHFPKMLVKITRGDRTRFE